MRTLRNQLRRRPRRGLGAPLPATRIPGPPASSFDAAQYVALATRAR